jgi:hypothetical protein
VLQLENTTPFAATMAVFPDRDGIDAVHVVVKATFTLARPLAVAAEPVPPVLADVYWGEPGASSLRWVSDVHLGKPSTDVALVGSAWAPGGARVEQLDVRLAVAGRDKTVRVFGDREWRGGLLGPSISAPEPFESMPLVYERAFGGRQELEDGSGKALAEERNPVGVGFRGKRKKKDLAGERLPNLEDPRQLLRKPGDTPPPAGFGFVAPNWLPRRPYAGTYDAAWQKGRAPYLPDDFDPRFFNAAPPELVFDRFLEGGEPVELQHASPDGPWSFRLPRCGIDLQVRIAGRVEEPPLRLETVLLEPDERRFCLTWRAAVRCDKQATRVEKVTIGLQRLDLGGAS